MDPKTRIDRREADGRMESARAPTRGRRAWERPTLRRLAADKAENGPIRNRADHSSSSMS